MSCVGTIALLYRHYEQVEKILLDNDYVLVEVEKNELHMINASNPMTGCQIAIFCKRDHSGIKVNFNRNLDTLVKEAILEIDSRATFTPARVPSVS